jgi:2-phosphoglycerate kinase
MLTQYLIGQGFSFKEAYQVSDEVRNAIQKRKTVSGKRMVDLVHQHARDLFGERPIGDGVFWAPGSRQILVEDVQGTRPFSREHLSHSLAVTGVDENQSYRMAERIAADFVRRQKTVVTREDLFKAALQVLASEAGEAYGERYWIWNWFRNEPRARPLVVMIGGASGVGKTSVGVALANLLRISRVASTDEIRQVMRLMISQDLMPAIHASSFAAWEHAPETVTEDVDPVIFGFREQVARVAVGVRAAVDRAIEENVSLILDGVHLLPDLLQLGEMKDKALFVSANLFLPDQGPFTERFEQRGSLSSRKKHRYLSHMKDILKLQQHILEVGEAHDVPAFENTDLDDTVQSIALYIMDTLREKAAPRSVRKQLAEALSRNGNGKKKP